MSKIKIHLLIPMSGEGIRFQNYGYTIPKPLVPISGEPMISRVLDNFPEHWESHFVISENHAKTQLPSILKDLRKNCNISIIPPHKLGPSFAALEALKHIPVNEPVFVSYCDYGMIWDSSQFERFIVDSSCEIALVSYRGFHAHYLTSQTYAYSKMSGELVDCVKEKGSFTDNRENEFASSGGYYFRSAGLLKECIDFQVSKNLSYNGEFYTSLTVQAYLQQNPLAHVRVFEIPGFFQWGTPEDIVTFEYWEKTFRAYNRNQRQPIKYTEQIIMPMAGKGSRFLESSKRPKPFIDIDGIPMYEKALQSLPQAKKTNIIMLDEHKSYITHSNYNFTSLSETPNGQALSTEFGFLNVDMNKDVIVSSCDHAIVLDSQVWQEFQKIKDCDAAIFTVKRYPGVARTPHSYSYVIIDNLAHPNNFPLVKGISLKAPTTENPLEEELLVGTFWFKKCSLLKQGIEMLKTSHFDLNKELYLDSIFNVLIQNNYKVLSIPLDGYICWGDPQALKESQYWYEIFTCKKV
ncbi:NTP transferase domain-containing protein [Pigmentibacter sp. JX0631]|uniref:NTP transferase domain-containing protein n=1 Tax=Pigmentibacter sp. JX0631 TaxID=2976982 RepID=UPI002469A6AA|nr:NTP transferase domain-containing protein [Pigmentibacter sp. JX0631]WGL60805.1 NTP transferase domain-containing protein [Pigmentibacter sp. JX0631]